MRFALTPPEAKLWEVIRAGQLYGVQFRRQVVLGRFIADFCATRERLVVEVDGQQHLKQRAADARRDVQLNQLGFAVLRLPASDVELRFELCLARVVDALGF